MTRNFMWNIAYYVAYSIIGDTNIANSINNYNVIFSGSQINSLSSTNYATLPAALEVYKGYNLVVADIVEDLMTLACSSNSSLSIGSSNWENTCFPELKKEMYIYYDKIDDVCDANNDESSDGGDDSGDEGDYDESGMDDIDPGTALKLKKVLLVPYIDTSKINISSFEITGLLIGYQAQDAGTYKVQMSVGGLNKDGGEISPTEVKFSGGDNIDGSKVIYDETYKFSEDLVDVSIQMGSELSNVEMTSGADGKTLVEGSFRKSTRTVSYASGGSKTIDIGYINVYNNLFNSNGEFNANKSVLELKFDYFNNYNTALTEIPTTYLMYFYIF